MMLITLILNTPYWVWALIGVAAGGVLMLATQFD